MSIQANWRPSQGDSVCHLTNGTGKWEADLDPAAGGNPVRPNPHELLDSALAACTTLTLQLYAKRRGYPLEDVTVTVSHQEGGGTYTMTRTVALAGAGLTQEIRDDLLRVANKCPVHKTLSGDIAIDTSLV